MKLSEIVSAAHGLAVYAEVALVLFFVAFLLVLVQVVSKRRAREWEESSALPLADDDIGMRGDVTKRIQLGSER